MTDTTTPTRRKRGRKPGGLTERDKAMYVHLQAGTTYAEVGRQFNISKQRVCQIAAKLARYGYPVNPLLVRLLKSAAQQAPQQPMPEPNQ